MSSTQRSRHRTLVVGSIAAIVATLTISIAISRTTPPAPAVGTLAIRALDDAGRAIPARLTFVGVDGTPTPNFANADTGVEQPGAILAFDRAFALGGTTLSLPAGSYDVWFSHGPEWEAVARRVQIAPGARTSIDATLRHVVDTPGWISGDFHVHAERSPDSKVPMRHRVHQFVADGVDLIVATDHNVIADYAPVIAALHQSHRLASLPGDEITTSDWGHFGAFPLTADDAARGRGAVSVGGRTPAAIFGELRTRDPRAVIDIHHPRLEDGRIGYFHLGELDTRTLQSGRAGFSFDFDAIEVLNGYQDPDRRSVDAVLADWFAFLRRGHRVTATGNSDSHHLTFNLGGYPRNYVQMPDDRLDPIDADALILAIKGGRSFFTTGPIIEVSVGDRGIGDTIATSGHPLALQVRVRAPAWIDVDRVSILLDGAAVMTSATDATAPIRFEETLSIPVARDGFVVVRVDGDRPMAPVIGDGDRFQVFPLAITNPIWIDVDGDGAISPSITP